MEKTQKFGKHRKNDNFGIWEQMENGTLKMLEFWNMKIEHVGKNEN